MVMGVLALQHFPPQLSIGLCPCSGRRHPQKTIVVSEMAADMLYILSLSSSSVLSWAASHNLAGCKEGG